MNPLDVIFSWQALLVAALAVAGTEVLKRSIDYTLAERKESVRGALRQGADLRRQLAMPQFILPLLPVVLGLIFGMSLPYKPSVLVAYYATTRPHADLALYGAWGIACGALGDYLYARLREPFKALRNQRVL